MTCCTKQGGVLRDEHGEIPKPQKLTDEVSGPGGTTLVYLKRTSVLKRSKAANSGATGVYGTEQHTRRLILQHQRTRISGSAEGPKVCYEAQTCPSIYM